ncbi:hypothetical protein G9C98_001925 [Cotesia typhae]|uniref:Uncharacterized protein n=1 Tax=Cotesia typhae TaxID=2053667 RepID=A0A8J5UT90_9HYME|nr:hypothetical protein G9C98_001925 [Cotesia typhae]
MSEGSCGWQRQNCGTRSRIRYCFTSIRRCLLLSPRTPISNELFITEHYGIAGFSHGARLPGRRRCRLRTCHHRHRFWQIPLHAVDNLRFDLYGHSNRSNNNIIRSTSSAMRPSNGLNIQGMAHGLPHVRNGDRIILLGMPG